MRGPALCSSLRTADLLNPHDEPARAIRHEPPFAEGDTGSEKGRDLSEAAQRMTWSRAVTQPGWSEVKALSLHHCTVLPLSKLALMPVMLQAGRAARNPGCGDIHNLVRVGEVWTSRQW